MELENIIEQLGSFGKYQVIIFVLINLAESPTAWAMVFMAVAGAVPDWWCVSDVSNNTVTYNKNYTTSPHFWQAENRSLKSCTDPSTGGSCSNIIYDENMETVATQFGLVCDRSWISATITTIQMGGVLLGACVTGQLGDLIGRKKTFYLVYSLVLVVDVLAIFSPSWQVFAALRFVLGLGCGGVLVVNFSLPIEFVGKKWRTMTGAIPFWSLGVMTLAFLSWLIPNWRHLSVAFACLGAPLLLSWWFIPESVRWLITHGKVDEAKSTLQRIAKFNGKPEPDLSNLEATVLSEVEAERRRAARYTYFDLFSSWEYSVKTLKFTCIWFSCGLTFYGLSFGAGALAGNIYLNIFLTGLVEAPAVASVIYFNNCAGRCKTAFVFLIISGLASLSVVIVVYTAPTANLTQITAALALTSKLGIAGGWISIQVFTAEHYPTVVRNLGYGFSSMAARIGSMVAPQVVYLGIIHLYLPYIIYGSLMAISAILVLTMKETHDTALPDEFDFGLVKSKKCLTKDTDPEISDQSTKM
ncbi:organic cation transporter protein-like [Liolophura sinensis]|uniref:organic cation transporter protein-like n=1 Tax=Liolophura sinensis TaxID=3198878 RepID=UPI0031585C41